MLDERSRDSAAVTRASLVIDNMNAASGNALLNKSCTRTLSKASWMTERMRGRWVVSITLVVPGTNISSVSTGHAAGGGLGAALRTSLGTTLGVTMLGTTTLGALLRATTLGAMLGTTMLGAMLGAMSDMTLDVTLGAAMLGAMKLGATLGATLGTSSTCIEVPRSDTEAS